MFFQHVYNRALEGRTHEFIDIRRSCTVSTSHPCQVSARYVLSSTKQHHCFFDLSHNRALISEMTLVGFVFS